MPVIGKPGGAKRERVYHLFRNKQRPQLVCAVAADRPLPRFLLPEQWLPEGSLGLSDAAPPGFRERAAASGMQLNGFYLFYRHCAERKLDQILDTARNRAA